MSDRSVFEALRSDCRLAVVEAPAGCGKTFQAALYARDIASSIAPGRILILTHTHAACTVFAERTRSTGNRIEIRTIDSLISEISTAYHLSLGLPPDTVAWARQRGSKGFRELAFKVLCLLQSSPIIASAIACRYPIVICDEHQDCSAEQHAIAVALLDAGARMRIFGDPMQRIYSNKSESEREDDTHRWIDLTKRAEAVEPLDTPHRWADGNEELGEWICSAREILRSGGNVDLRKPLPRGLKIVFAENNSAHHNAYRVAKNERALIDSFVNSRQSIMILAAHNASVRSLRAFWNRRIPIWEGHTRDAMSELVEKVKKHRGSAPDIAKAILAFMDKVARGFTLAAYGKDLLNAIEDQCAHSRRGKPGIVQGLAKIILNEPDHKGVSQFLRRIHELSRSEKPFYGINVDLRNEFWEAVKLGDFDDPEQGLSEITQRRSRSQEGPPVKAISTVHKAKGLECDNVLLMACDGKHFPESSRCLLYVALSRAKKSLQIVVSRENPSPLLELPR